MNREVYFNITENKKREDENRREKKRKENTRQERQTRMFIAWKKNRKEIIWIKLIENNSLYDENEAEHGYIMYFLCKSLEDG